MMTMLSAQAGRGRGDHAMGELPAMARWMRCG